MKKFDIPSYYRSGITGKVKEARRITDPRKKDFTPTLLDFGPIQFYIARHFGFCYGVENAIEISYKALEENPGKRIFLLSQMIHNQAVNADLESKGIRFIMDTKGKQFVPWDDIKADDVVIIPAFGTTLEIEALLKEKGVATTQYDTTCPFVTRVWKKSEKLGQSEYSIVIHGKPDHEETRATFSHSKAGAPSIVIRDIDEARQLADFISGDRDLTEFDQVFANRYSSNFDPKKDLQRIGVVNQTTMLATETQAIADYLKQVITERFGAEYFADTRDTLCYATNDNQQATYALLEEPADLAIVVGGYNSSNTSHIVELCEGKFPTYFINSAAELKDDKTVGHFDWRKGVALTTDDYLPSNRKPLRVVLTSGASCPDTLVDEVMLRLLSFFEETRSIEEVVEEATSAE